EQDDSRGRRDRRDEDPALEVAAPEEEVADRAGREDARDGAAADDEQHERPERLVDPVLLRHELDAEGLDAGEEVVPERARQDEDDVRPDPEDVAGRLDQAEPARVAVQDEVGVGLEAALAREPLRVSLARALLARLVVLGSRLRVHERVAPAAPQRTIAAPRIQVLRTRSARTPNGRLAIAATSEVTVTSRPMSVFVMWSACRSGVADAPTVEASALERARTEASSTITRVRSAPPS